MSGFFYTMTFSSEKIAQLDTLLASSKRILITAHKSPDGDSVGSSLGLWHYLKSIGLNPTVCHPDRAPDFLWWLDGESAILNYEGHKEEIANAFQEADLIFCLDYNSTGRIGKLDEHLSQSSAKRVMIDHHRDPDLEFCDLIFSDDSKSSTAEMIYELIEAKNDSSKLNEQVGTPLYCGIVTDTGSFRFPSTSPKTLRAAAALAEAGVKHWLVYENIYDNKTEDQIRLSSYAMLEKLVIKKEYATSYIAMTQIEQQRFHAKKGDTEGLVNQALAIKGVRMAVFFKESDGLIKISFRSKGDVPVNDLARDHFEGGGHKNAAGGKFVGKMEDAIRRFESVLPQFWK